MSNSWVARGLGDGGYEWARTGPSTQPHNLERGDLQAMRTAAQSRPLVLLVDGREVRMLEAVIPARSQRQAQQAAPFAIEDELADELEQLQVVCGALGANGKRAVAVVKQEVLRRMLDPLASGGVQLARLLPDYLALPHRAEHWSLMQDGARVLVRTDLQQGFACDVSLFDAIAGRLEQVKPPRGLDLFGDVTVPSALAKIPQLHHALPHGALVLLAQGSAEANTLNLLPAQYRSDRHRANGGLRLAAALGVLALGVHCGFLVRDTQRLEVALASTRAAQTETMQRAFPNITRVVNAEVQATQAMTEMRGRTGDTMSALTLLHLVGRGLHAASSPALALENLNYADGVLSVRLAAPDIASLEGYSESLKPFAQVEVVAVEARESGVGGSLRVQAARSGTP